MPKLMKILLLCILETTRIGYIQFTITYNIFSILLDLSYTYIFCYLKTLNNFTITYNIYNINFKVIINKIFRKIYLIECFSLLMYYYNDYNKIMNLQWNHIVLSYLTINEFIYIKQEKNFYFIHHYINLKQKN